MNRADWILLAISAAGGKPLQPVQLQKSWFLRETNGPEAMGGATFGFTPYDYGPFSADVYREARRLADQGLAAVSQRPGGWSEYAATPAGLAKAERLKGEGQPEAV